MMSEQTFRKELKTKKKRELCVMLAMAEIHEEKKMTGGNPTINSVEVESAVKDLSFLKREDLIDNIVDRFIPITA